MDRKQSDYNEPYRSKKHGIWYYVIWFAVCVVFLVVLMLIRHQFSWERFAATVSFMAVMSVIWFFMDRFIHRQEEAAIRRLEEKFGKTIPQEEDK